jgi:hypothetical protein
MFFVAHGTLFELLTQFICTLFVTPPPLLVLMTSTSSFSVVSTVLLSPTAYLHRHDLAGTRFQALHTRHIVRWACVKSDGMYPVINLYVRTDIGFIPRVV